MWEALAALAAAVGVAVALWSLRQSRSSLEEARKANTLAESATAAAREANALAATANETAVSALEVSRAAEARDNQLAAIATEFRDVRWRYSFGNPDVISFMNVGTTPAKGVSLVVRIATFDVEERPTEDWVFPDHAIGMSLSHLVRHHREAHEQILKNQNPGTHKEPWVLPAECTLIWSSPAGQYEKHEETVRFEKSYPDW